ncbi:MAG: LacI family DNA-binding transcriptional regulator [Lentisphaeria bacterium]|nr:LacI family DNA-binding transcriptional regulator [Lentisphaeria bacterium]
MAITTKQIAEMVGVSRQAVSAVLNGNPGKVSEEKRRKIFHIAQNLQWRPDPAGLRLAGRAPARFIGIDTGFFPPHKQSLTEALTMLLAERGYQVRLTPPGDKQHKLRVMYDFAAEGAAGIFTDIGPELFDWKNFPVPLVVIGNQERPCDIAFDYGPGIRRLVRHLHEVHGHRKMAFIGLKTNDSLSTGPAQSIAFKAALKENGLPFAPDQVMETVWNEGPFAEVMKLIRKKQVTVLLCEQDALAAKLIADLERSGIRCPDDVAVTGSGTSFITELTRVPLTSIYLPVLEHARNAVALMFEKIEKNFRGMEKKPRLTPTGLFLGGSCGCPPAKLPPLYWEGIPQSLEDLFTEIRNSNRYELFRKYLEFDRPPTGKNSKDTTHKHKNRGERK